MKVESLSRFEPEEKLWKMNQPILRLALVREQIDLRGRDFEDGLRRRVEAFAHTMGKLGRTVRLG